MHTPSPPVVCYADAARCIVADIVSHRLVAENTYRLRIDCPEIAAFALPGQFVMLRIPERVDPLLARPLAVYDTFTAADTEPSNGDTPTEARRRYADFIYTVQGKFTTALKELAPGAQLLVWGPLGNGFSVPTVDHLLLVAGGIGQTALLALGRECLGNKLYGSSLRSVPRAKRVTFCWGARHGGLFGDVTDFRDAGMDVRLATLDGSVGHRGTVVDLLDELAQTEDLLHPQSIHIACCGPEGMMAAVARWSAARKISCDVSLEAPMACGIGICFTCVAKIRDAFGEWDYRRTCIEGPVFNAMAIDW